MTREMKTHDSIFRKAAIYKIVVQGEIDSGWPIQLWGLQVNVQKINGKMPISVLVGQINDQAALSGVLNKLYDMHLTVISVNMLSEIENA